MKDSVESRDVNSRQPAVQRPEARQSVQNSWDWQTGKKVLADLGEVRRQYDRVDELSVSYDGEIIAAPVQTDGTFTVWTNRGAWPDPVDS